MKNRNLANEFSSLRGYDQRADDVLAEAQRYIEFLEGKEDRLIKLEGVLNTIEDGNLAFKDDFLALFSEFKNA